MGEKGVKLNSNYIFIEMNLNSNSFAFKFDLVTLSST